MKPINVAVIGVGHLGKFHAQKLSQLPGYRLVAVVDPIPENRCRVAEQLATQARADHRELIGMIDAAHAPEATSTRFEKTIRRENALRMPVTPRPWSWETASRSSSGERSPSPERTIRRAKH